MPDKGGLLLLLKSNMLGDGEADLGERLLKSWLEQLLDYGEVPGKIACLNTGIFLTTTGSPVKDTLKAFEDLGTEILSCSTCLNYYGRTDKLVVGEPTNMKETVGSMLSAARILTL